MASVKVVSLLIKTLSKPIANRLKISAQEHPKFRTVCVGLAQSLHRYETRLASGIFAKAHPVIRPLSDTKAIQNGANFLSEAFLFSVAVALIVAENLRGRMQTAHRRDVVNDRLTELESLCADIRAEQESLDQRIQPLFLLLDNQPQEDSSVSRLQLSPTLSDSSQSPSSDNKTPDQLDQPRPRTNEETARRAETAPRRT
ncbi:hypothetical protein PCANC_07737 [Puccinia coronata f. sp. avenae]|uniref:OPA3-like protein n=1 Tax=Puccinia coronata f. sp. avenae TaxID=200324 RepID=A0A2N5VRF3_9BASI|nr:hypothetical protein PCANC_22557 [Puccinia coronata f. sp. avenae]PLW31425.1 hypothetical protein PCASD_18557 [Puccinia coronata f. sp. avenae]PLW52546.1 hypothetical protein PCANC_07737 [Puccinia coronata f. sp. avenae]